MGGKWPRYWGKVKDVLWGILEGIEDIFKLEKKETKEEVITVIIYF